MCIQNTLFLINMSPVRLEKCHILFCVIWDKWAGINSFTGENQ